ncbi:MAG TPA: DUF4215 domain-containing protein [Candidatus Nanoarchaeia archaeon]|nr:DUF4215 domain-containing protein [Candidatus Nanoarchaeia archaeon]
MDKRILSVMIIAILSMIMLAGCGQEPIGEAKAFASPNFYSGPSGTGGLFLGTNPKLGNVHIVLSQPGTTVEKYSFDTIATGKDLGSNYKGSITAGTYTLTASLQGYQTYTETVTIQIKKIRFRIIKLTPATEPGAAICGNGQVQNPETCDDGNTVSGDGCSATCATEAATPAVCGNNKVESTEVCDYESKQRLVDPNGNTVWRTSPAVSCVDSNGYSGDKTCLYDCSAWSACASNGRERCGDGVKNGNEACDDGGIDKTNMLSVDSCKADCSATRCPETITASSCPSSWAAVNGEVNLLGAFLAGTYNRQVTNPTRTYPDSSCTPANPPLSDCAPLPIPMAPLTYGQGGVLRDLKLTSANHESFDKNYWPAFCGDGVVDECGAGSGKVEGLTTGEVNTIETPVPKGSLCMPDNQNIFPSGAIYNSLGELSPSGGYTSIPNGATLICCDIPWTLMPLQSAGASLPQIRGTGGQTPRWNVAEDCDINSAGKYVNALGQELTNGKCNTKSCQVRCNQNYAWDRVTRQCVSPSVGQKINNVGQLVCREKWKWSVAQGKCVECKAPLDTFCTGLA